MAGTGAELDRATRRKLRLILANQVENKGVAGLQAAVRLRHRARPGWVPPAWLSSTQTGPSTTTPCSPSPASPRRSWRHSSCSSSTKARSTWMSPSGRTSRMLREQRHATVRQLLSHTSGIYNFFENPRYGRGRAGLAACRSDRPATRGSTSGRTTRSWVWSRTAATARSATCYHYSNTNFVILGKIAEAVEGKPLHKQLRATLLRPAGHGGHRLPAGGATRPGRGPWPLGQCRWWHTSITPGTPASCPSWRRPAWPTLLEPSPPRPRTSPSGRRRSTVASCSRRTRCGR